MQMTLSTNRIAPRVIEPRRMNDVLLVGDSSRFVGCGVFSTGAVTALATNRRLNDDRWQKDVGRGRLHRHAADVTVDATFGDSPLESLVLIGWVSGRQPPLLVRRKPSER